MKREEKPNWLTRHQQQNKDYTENSVMTTITRCWCVAAGPGNELHKSAIFVTLILEHTFKWRSLGVSEACNWLTASAGPHGKHWNYALYAVAHSIKARRIRYCLFLSRWEKCVWGRSEKKETKSTSKKLHCLVSLSVFLGGSCQHGYWMCVGVQQEGFDPECCLLGY